MAESGEASRPEIPENNAEEKFYPGNERTRPFVYYVQTFSSDATSPVWEEMVGRLDEDSFQISGVLLSDQSLVWSDSAPNHESLSTAYNEEDTPVEIGALQIKPPKYGQIGKLHIFADTHDIGAKLSFYLTQNLPSSQDMPLEMHILDAEQKKYVKTLNGTLGDSGK